jgi:hypothetical protein
LGDLGISRRIVANAQRLFADAEVLFMQQRFPTATALYVMSVEELGKLAMLVRGNATTSDPSKHKGFHAAKHGAASITHLSQASIMAANAIANRVGLKIVRVEDAPPGVEPVGITDFLLGLPPAELDAYMDAFRAQLAELPDQVLSQCRSQNEAMNMRNRALYLDFDVEGVTSDPADVGEVEALAWREYAAKSLSLVDITEQRIRTIRIPNDQ